MLLLSLIIVHFIADFLLQTDEMVKDKLKSLKKHIFHHFLLTLFLLLGLWVMVYSQKDLLSAVFIPALFISCTHLLIDLLKVKLVDMYMTRNNSQKLLFFILDQLLHLFMLLIALQLFYGIELEENILKFTQLLFNENSDLSITNKALFLVVILLLGTTVSGHIIRILLGSLPGQLLTFEGKYSFKNVLKEAEFPQNIRGEKGLSEEYSYMIFNKHDLSRGKLIGYIERLLVILLTFYSAFPAIAFIVTAKSIARFKQMDDRDWAEYFLLGTLTSMFLGILFGILLREVLT
jgi:hypothetical protein